MKVVVITRLVAQGHDQPSNSGRLVPWSPGSDRSCICMCGIAERTEDRKCSAIGHVRS